MSQKSQFAPASTFVQVHRITTGYPELKNNQKSYSMQNKLVYLVFEHIALPPVNYCLVNHELESKFVNYKAYYQILFNGTQMEAELISGDAKVAETLEPLYKVQNNKKVQFSPIQVLNSKALHPIKMETEKQQQNQKPKMYEKLPFYSSQCKLLISFYQGKDGKDFQDFLSYPHMYNKIDSCEITKKYIDQQIKKAQNPQSIQQTNNVHLSQSSLTKSRREEREKNNQLFGYQYYLGNLSILFGPNLKLKIKLELNYIISKKKNFTGFFRAVNFDQINFGNHTSSNQNSGKKTCFTSNQFSRISYERNYNDLTSLLNFSGRKQRDPQITIERTNNSRSQKSKSIFQKFLSCFQSQNADRQNQIVTENANQRSRRLNDVDLYLGPCENKNLFSVLDKGVKNQNCNIVSPKFQQE